MRDAHFVRGFRISDCNLGTTPRTLSTVLPQTCLVITALDLSGLETSVHGIFQRFRAVVEAFHLLDFDIRIAAPVAPGMTESARQIFELNLERQIGRAWGIPVRVTALPSRSPPDLPRRFLRLLGALRHRWSAGSFALGGRETLQALSGENRPDVIFAHRLPTVQLALAIAGRQPLVLDLDDVEHQKIGRSLGLAGSRFDYLVGWLSSLSLLRAERKACQSATTTLVCSEDDARYLSDAFGGRVVAVPNAVAVPTYSRPSGERPILLMVGIYSYGPNADAAEYFIKDIFPSIRSAVPDVEVWFVGRGGESLEATWRAVEGVRFLGFQLDLAPLYAQARVAICPIREGGGTRIKIIEAAAYGVACVSTTVGAEGLSLVDGESILIADDAAAFSDRCVALLGDAEEAIAIGKAAHAVAQARYSREGQLDRLVSVLRN